MTSTLSPALSSTVSCAGSSAVSPAVQSKSASKPSSGFGAGRWQGCIALMLTVAFLAGCSSGPGSREEFVEVLTRDGNLSEDEATCISDGVFAEYEADEDSLKRISEAVNLDDLEGEGGVAGFAEFYDKTVRGCAQAGPAPG